VLDIDQKLAEDSADAAKAVVHSSEAKINFGDTISPTTGFGDTISPTTGFQAPGLVTPSLMPRVPEKGTSVPSLGTLTLGELIDELQEPEYDYGVSQQEFQQFRRQVVDFTVQVLAAFKHMGLDINKHFK